MNDIGDNLLSWLNAALDLSYRRGNLISGNLANVDTPNFTPQDMDFEEALAVATETWQNELSKIKVTDSSTVNKTKFYTGLFHALLGRGLASDVNGQFPQNQ